MATDLNDPFSDNSPVSPLRVGVAVAQFHLGNTSEYVQNALIALGHQSEIIDPARLASSLADHSFDLYLCVDSGEPFNFCSGPLAQHSLENLGFWFIDYRHNKNRPTRKPNDLENLLAITARGGLIFQSQYEDLLDCKEHGVERCFWVPLAADPEVWSDQPEQNKLYHLGFVGNVWDQERATVLTSLINTPDLKFAFMGHGQAWKEKGAELLRSCLVGFNINSFFGEPFAYDLNMRVFETLSCGIPLITNAVPSLERIFGQSPSFIRQYKSTSELPEVIRSALNDNDFLSSGQAARNYIVEKATYTTRVKTILETLLSRNSSKLQGD